MTKADNAEQTFKLSTGGLVHRAWELFRGPGANEISIRTQFVMALIAPFLPLVLTEFSITDLLNRIADALV